MPAASTYPLAVRAVGDFLLGTNAGGAVKRFAESGRIPATGNLTLYFRSDGSDSGHDGSVDDAAHAFASIQGAFDYAAFNYDFRGYELTIKHGNEGAGPITFNVGSSYVLYAYAGMLGIAGINVEGNAADITTPSKLVFSGTNADLFVGESYGVYPITLNGFTGVVSGTSGSVLSTYGYPSYFKLKNLRFGACPSGHILNYAGNIVCSGPLEVFGSAPNFVYSSSAYASFNCNQAITFTGTPAFSAGFCAAYGASYSAFYGGFSYSGAMTGAKYSIQNGGFISGIAVLPGSAGSGGTTTGGGFSA